MKTYTRLLSETSPEAAADDRVIRFTFATDQIALDGHRILAGAWKSKDHDGLKIFKSNPVFQWAHDLTQPPIGKVISIDERGGKLTGAVKFATYDFAEQIYQLFRGGFMRGASVSWQPIEWAYAKGPGRERDAIDFKKVCLLEISAVPVPSDSDALAEARSAGLNLSAVATWASKGVATARTDAERRSMETFSRALSRRHGGAIRTVSFQDMRAEAEKHAARIVAQTLIYSWPADEIEAAASASCAELVERAVAGGLSRNETRQIEAIFETKVGRYVDR
jgi:hypothetical protein